VNENVNTIFGTNSRQKSHFVLHCSSSVDQEL